MGVRVSVGYGNRGKFYIFFQLRGEHRRLMYGGFLVDFVRTRALREGLYLIWRNWCTEWSWHSIALYPHHNALGFRLIEHSHIPIASPVSFASCRRPKAIPLKRSPEDLAKSHPTLDLILICVLDRWRCATDTQNEPPLSLILWYLHP